MSKRLSKARRAKALNQALVQTRARLNDDSAKLQQGPVRCALNRGAASYTNLKMPKQSDGHARTLDRTQTLRANPAPAWAFDYTKVKGYKPIGE